jgi:cytochrome P450
VIDKPLVQDFATEWDHADPQWVADPYPIWEDLRERCPVAHTDRYGGGWFPATHAGVSAIAKDTENFTSRTVIIGNGRPTELDLPAPIGVAPPITRRIRHFTR